MKKFGLFPLIYGFTLSLPLGAGILPVLPRPNANELTSPVFLQTFAGLSITSFSGGIGTTEPFFDTLPPDAISGPIMNILGNFQAFDRFGNPTSFNILGVRVTESGSTFTPAFGTFNFAGHPSVTFTDSLTFDTVTFNAGNPTLALPVDSGQFQFHSRHKPGFGGLSITFQIVETGTVPSRESSSQHTSAIMSDCCSGGDYMVCSEDKRQERDPCVQSHPETVLSGNGEQKTRMLTHSSTTKGWS